MFEKNGYAFHNGDGVCLIKDIMSMCFDGKTTRNYYCLEPVGKNKGVCFVPVDNSSTLREITDESTLSEMLDNAEKIPLICAANPKLRANAFKEALKSKTCENYIRVLKTLSNTLKEKRKAGKTLSSTDEKFRNEAFENLKNEIAVSFKISSEKAEEKIKTALFYSLV